MLGQRRLFPRLRTGSSRGASGVGGAASGLRRAAMAGPAGAADAPPSASRPPPSEAEARIRGASGPRDPPTAGPAPGALVADTDPRRGLSHREATARLRHFGANAPPRPPASLGSPPTSRSAFLAALASPALRACWFALACQLLHAILAEIRDANAHETLPEMALDDTDDSAGPGRGARASWLDAALLAALLASPRHDRGRRRAQSVVARAGGADGTTRRARPRRPGGGRRGELVGDLVRLAAGIKAGGLRPRRPPGNHGAIVEVDEEDSSASLRNTTNAPLPRRRRASARATRFSRARRAFAGRRARS